MAKDLLLAIDQGTTSSRAILFNTDGHIQQVAQKESRLNYPEKGWVEQDAHDIWQDTLSVCRKAIKGAEDRVAAIGITNQRETTILWDRNTGEPLAPAIIWQDRRTAAFCASMKDAGHEDIIRAKTGLLLDPYFSASKIRWILDHVDGAQARAERGEICFGTVDSFLIWHLTGGVRHVTDITNASRTMLYNIVTQEWDAELLELFNIPAGILPEVLDNVADFGATDLFGPQLSIGGVAGDQQAAVIGQACFSPGMIKSTYGTGCFALMNIGPEFRESENKLLTTPAYRFNGEITYAIEGSIFVAGAAIQWLRDQMGLFQSAPESEAVATSVEDNHGVYFVPAFTGLGAPYWKADAQALITGLTRDSTAAHITRAALEAQAYQTCDLIGAMERDSGHRAERLRADGGLVANRFMCQFLSDMLDKPVDVPVVAETTALGAAYLAGLSCGLYQDLDDIAQRWQSTTRYEPVMTAAACKALYEGWQQAIRRTLAD